jgi:hypothetical protein
MFTPLQAIFFCVSDHRQISKFPLKKYFRIFRPTYTIISTGATKTSVASSPAVPVDPGPAVLPPLVALTALKLKRYHHTTLPSVSAIPAGNTPSEHNSNPVTPSAMRWSILVKAPFRRFSRAPPSEEFRALQGCVIWWGAGRGCAEYRAEWCGESTFFFKILSHLSLLSHEG